MSAAAGGRFVVVGGDAAGMSAASRARRLDPSLEVTVLERTQDVSYSACGMPFNIADPGRSIEELVVRRAEEFRSKSGIDVLTGHRAVAIDRTARTVTVEAPEGTVSARQYDRLLIATGARPVVPERPGFELEGVATLKSLEQGRALKTFLASRRVERAVILGMGFVALELSDALRARGVEVTLAKPRAELLPWMPAELSAVVRRELEDHEVRLRTGFRADCIEREGSALKVVGQGEFLPADLVVVAIGVRPNSELAADAGLALGPSGAVAVDRALRTSDPAIYAAGDCADAYHVVTGEKTWIPLALRANRAGWAVADNVCGGSVELPGIVGSAVFRVFSLEVARTGLTVEEAGRAGFDAAHVTITARSRAHGHPGSTPILVHLVGARKSGRLLGAQLVGREGVAHRIHAPAVALHARMTVEQFLQCDLAYTPPFGPVWDPLLTAANQLVRAL